jgi:DNA-binding NarL/FixJ family response regulator
MRLPPNSSPLHVRVLIADSNMMACRLLATALERHAHLTIVAAIVDKASLLRAAKETSPDVALISAGLQDGAFTGLAALQEIRALHPTIRTVLLKDRRDPHLVVEAFRAGARGVFSRSESELGALYKCVCRVHEGQIWANTRQLECLIEAVTRTQPLRVVDAEGSCLLSKREEDVVLLVAEGLGNREIAQQLTLSEHTVKNYLFRIFDKLGISNRVELVLYAVLNTGSGDPNSTRAESAASVILNARNKIGPAGETKISTAPLKRSETFAAKPRGGSQFPTVRNLQCRDSRCAAKFSKNEPRTPL